MNDKMDYLYLLKSAVHSTPMYEYQDYLEQQNTTFIHFKELAYVIMKSDKS